MNDNIKIVLVDDNNNIVQTLKKSFSLFEKIEVVFTASNGIDLLQKLEYNNTPDVIIIDLDMPLMNGIGAIVEIRKRYSNIIKIIVLTVLDTDEKIFDSIHAGANAYLLKDQNIEKIVGAIHEVLDGGVSMSPSIANKLFNMLKNNISELPTKNKINFKESMIDNFNLTDREIEIIKLIAEGQTYKSVAEKLFISDRTVNKHMENIYKKLNINSKIDIIKIVQKYNG